MSDDPIPWRDDPSAPPGAAELVRSLEGPPPVPPAMRLRMRDAVRAEARPPNRWIGPATVAAAVMVGGLLLWRFSPGNAPAAEPTPLEPEVAEQLAPVAAPAGERPAVENDEGDPSVETPADVAIAGEAEVRAPEPRARQATRPSPEPRSMRPTPRTDPLLDGEHLQGNPFVGLGESSRAGTKRAPESSAWPQRDGTLVINTIPWARVFIDGRDTGQNTPVRNLRLSPGRHRVGLRTVDGTMHMVTIEVSSGETVRLLRRL